MKVKLFAALPKAGCEGELQGILYPDNHVEIGVDVWRNLSKYDFASHPVYEYRSVREAKHEYTFKKPRELRYFYMNNIEERRENSGYTN